MEEKQKRVLKPGEQNLQARVVMYQMLKRGLGKCQSRVSAGPPEVLASEIRDGKYRNWITIGHVRMNWTFNTKQ